MLGKDSKKNRPKTPLLLETNTIPFLEINKSFQFLRLERWRTPSSFANGVKLFLQLENFMSNGMTMT